MTSLQEHEYLFELVHDSVMLRSIEGTINFWNRSAEELYGWRKEEAIGKVSHNLLQTQFPKPLEEIESELVQNGLWEGKLVHTTRDGGRVVVESRWTLDLKGQSGAVVEINTRSTDWEIQPEAHTDEIATERKQAQIRLEQTVTSLQHHEYLFELIHDSVMLRSIEGTINFWNRSAEELYGWRKEEAIGKVSHNLLQTQFPKPLGEIDTELVRHGLWEGKLVHTTRDGRRVVVESRWALDLKGHSGAVVEINRRSIELDPEARVKQVTGAASKLINAHDLVTKIANLVLAGGAFLCITAVLLYGLFGHDLIKGMYDGKFLGIDKWLMLGKAVTPLENYYEHANSLILLWTLRLIIFIPLGIVLLKKPLGVLIAACSGLIFSFLLFSVVEFFPAFVKLLHLDILPFYSFRQAYVADDVLAFRMKPFFRNKLHNFKGDNYSPAYRIDVPSGNPEEVYDEHGFKNDHPTEYSDVVVLGDSYVADGVDNADTFPRRLERNLSGLTVANLGTAGYGPHQYLEILKRYGIQKKPKYVLFGFFEGNDLEDIVSYLRWKEGSPGGRTYGGIYDALSASTLMEKYTLAFSQTVRYARERIWAHLWAHAKLFFDWAYGSRQSDRSVHPDIAILKLEDNTYKVLLPITETNSRSTDAILRSLEFPVLRELLAEFKRVCITNRIVPIVLYLPTAVHIYAEYSTDESGSYWLRRRSQQISTKENTETALRSLSSELEIDFISLSPIFEGAAEEGKLLYYPLDSHWNPEGKEVAARFVADVLRSKHNLRSISTR